MEDDKKEAKPLTKEEALAAFKKAAAEGNVEIGNAAFNKADPEKEINVVAWMTKTGLGFDFAIKKFGFGQIFLTLDKSAKEEPVDGGAPGHTIRQGRLFIDSEHMSRDTVKAILCQAVDDATMEWEELERTIPEGSA